MAPGQAFQASRVVDRCLETCIVLQLLPHTLGRGPEVRRVTAKCHDVRNKGEYEGRLMIDERLVVDLLVAARAVAAKLSKLGPTAKA